MSEATGNTVVKKTGMALVFLEFTVFIYLRPVLLGEMPTYSSKTMAAQWWFTCGT